MFNNCYYLSHIMKDALQITCISVSIISIISDALKFLLPKTNFSVKTVFVGLKSLTETQYNNKNTITISHLPTFGC